MVSMVFRLGPSPPLPFSLLTSELGAPRRVLAAILVPSSDVSTYSSQLEQPCEEICDVPGVDILMLGLCPSWPVPPAQPLTDVLRSDPASFVIVARSLCDRMLLHCFSVRLAQSHPRQKG